MSISRQEDMGKEHCSISANIVNAWRERRHQREESFFTYYPSCSVSALDPTEAQAVLNGILRVQEKQKKVTEGLYFGIGSPHIIIRHELPACPRCGKPIEVVWTWRETP